MTEHTERRECVLETHPEWGGCCCQCKYHWGDYSHPHTDGGSAMTQRGWVCVAFGFCEATPSAFSEWCEHGLCELFERVPKQQDAVRGAALEAGVVGEMVEALRAFVEAWEKSHQLVKTDVAHRKARAVLAKLDQEGSE